MWWWVSVALAASPDKVATTWSLGSTAVDPVIASPDGRLIAAVSGGTLHLLDTETWEIETASPCTVQAATVERLTETQQWVYLGCADGTVHPYEWNDGVFGPALDTESAAIVYDVAEDPVIATFWASGNTTLYVLTQNGNALSLHTVLPDTGDVDGDGFPMQLVQTGFVDGGISLTTLWIAHGADDVTQLSIGGTAPIINPTPDPYSVHDAVESSRAGFYAVDSQGVVLEYVFSGNAFSLLLSGLGTIEALGVSRSTDDEWMLVTDASTARAYPMEGGVLTGSTPDATFTSAGGVDEIAVGRFSYAFGGTSSGDLVLYTANPWVDDVAATPSGPLADGETTTVTFTLDEPADWEIRLGGDSTGGGEVLETGTAAAAGTVTVPLVADGTWTEGTSLLYVFADDDAGNTGHGRTTVTVDNPPGAPELTGDSLRFGDGFLRLGFDAIGDADLASYAVYVTINPFDPEDYETGGPAFDGTDALEAPLVFEYDGAESFDEIIYPLTNGVRYYVAVRATDAGGKEGPMSVVVDGVPKPTFSASEAAGETGGAPCDTGSATPGLFAGLIALAAVRRRRLPLAPLLGAAALLLAMPAEAGNPCPAPGKRPDDTASWGNVELRYGGATLRDPQIQATYEGKVHDMLMIEFGPQICRVAELDVGLGFYQDLGFKLDEEGEQSGQRAMLTLWPLSVSGTARLHILDEQVIVPFVKGGFDYVLWGEEWEVVSTDSDGVASTTREKKHGAKAGYHYAIGASLLLDTFDRRRASYLEAQTGINDTSIVFEWRRQKIDPGEFLFFENSRGLSFSGDLITVGLKLDF